MKPANTPRTPTTALVRFDEVEGPPSKYLVDHDRLFILCAVVQSSYCYFWDVQMDWGLLSRDPRARFGYRLREPLLVTQRKSTYLALCLFNFSLRCAPTARMHYTRALHACIAALTPAARAAALPCFRQRCPARPSCAPGARPGHP